MAGDQAPRHVAVLGAGVSGVAAARLLQERGFAPALFAQSASSIEAQVTVLEDQHQLASALLEYDPEFVVVSPGIPFDSLALTELRDAGVPLVSEVQLAWDMQGPEGAAWLAVTGTNGKTTTVSMLAAILSASNRRALAAGNIGFPLSAGVLEDADALAVELSSFQLAMTDHLAPLAAICLNIDDDHLDWHGSKEAYRAAKATIYNGVYGARLFFADQPEVERMAREARSEAPLVPLTFGSVHPGQLGIVGTVVVDRAFGEVDGEELVDLADLPSFAAIAAHDFSSAPLVLDALAAIGLARAAGSSQEEIVEGLAHFSTPAHRRTTVLAGPVTWVDDSKATNVHAALTSARGVADGKLLWIVGGDAKGQDLSALFDLARTKAKGLAFLGADKEPLWDLRNKHCPDVPVLSAATTGTGLGDLRAAVRACAESGEVGDTVLLAPGCASWDQFGSFEERGSLFEEAVLSLQ